VLGIRGGGVSRRRIAAGSMAAAFAVGSRAGACEPGESPESPESPESGGIGRGTVIEAAAAAAVSDATAMCGVDVRVGGVTGTSTTMWGSDGRWGRSAPGLDGDASCGAEPRRLRGKICGVDTRSGAVTGCAIECAIECAIDGLDVRSATAGGVDGVADRSFGIDGDDPSGPPGLNGPS
jgi:hypothetical protein